MTNTLSEISKQLQSGKQLRLNQKKWLIEYAEAVESGEDANTALNAVAVSNSGTGKNSAKFLASSCSRKNKLSIAFLLLKGSDWSRCQQLASIGVTVCQEMKADRFSPKTEVERLLSRIIKSGRVIPKETKNIKSILFK